MLDIDGAKVNEGDKVVCIDDRNSFGRLRVGSIYTAECIKWDKNDKNTYVMAGNPAAVHSMERFRKL